MTKQHSGALSMIPVSDIAAQLAGQAESLCRHLLPGGRREGAEWRCGSVQGEHGKSLGVHLNGAKAGVWADFATGEGGDLLDLIKSALKLDTPKAIGWAKNWLGIDDGPAPRPRPAPKVEKQDKDATKRTEAALAIWRASRPAPQTPVESYLWNRSITISVPPTLRYNPGVRYERSGLCLPCMVAAVQAPDRRVVAVHRTWVRSDGRGQAGVASPKKALGPIGVGAVRLGPAQPALGLAEGVETALSIMQLFGIPVWAALGSRMDRIELPDNVIEVQIFGDNGKRGHEAAEKAADNFMNQGQRVVLRFPPVPFGDWNDALQALCKESS